jgi:hypothetical protein
MLQARVTQEVYDAVVATGSKSEFVVAAVTEKLDRDGLLPCSGCKPHPARKPAKKGSDQVSPLFKAPAKKGKRR